MNLKFKTKLMVLCGFMASISMIISVISYKSLKGVEESYSEVTEDSLPNLNNLNNMFLSYRSVRINLRTLGLPGVTKQQADEYIKHVYEAINDYEASEKEYLSVQFNPGEEEIFNKVKLAWNHFKGVGALALEQYTKGTPESKEKLLSIFLNDCPEAAKNYTLAINELKKYHIERAKTNTLTAKEKAAMANQLILLTSVLGILVGLSFAFFFSNSVSNTLNKVVNSLVDNSTHVAETSTQIAGASQSLSESTTEQASSLQQTAASLEEITSMITKASESAVATAESSIESQKKAEEGREAVEKMLSSMDEISQSNEEILNQINESNRQMTEIVQVIEDIGSKTKVINEIVFQTKLLSFNASVEAARAGEHGKGFAVVAEEVGNLAQMSGNAAKEITDMLGSSISKVEAIVQNTKTKVELLVTQGKNKVDNGVAVARQCSQVLDEIVHNVSRVSGLSQEISHASKEQSQGVSEINKAMAQLDTVTQQNSSTSEEAASAAEKLSAQSMNLKLSVDELLSVINGNKFTGTNSEEKVKEKHLKNVKRVDFAKAKKQKPSTPKSSIFVDHEIKKASGAEFVPSSDDEGFS